MTCCGMSIASFATAVTGVASASAAPGRHVASEHACQHRAALHSAHVRRDVLVQPIPVHMLPGHFALTPSEDCSCKTVIWGETSPPPGRDCFLWQFLLISVLARVLVRLHFLKQKAPSSHVSDSKLLQDLILF